MPVSYLDQVCTLSHCPAVILGTLFAVPLEIPIAPSPALDPLLSLFLVLSFKMMLAAVTNIPQKLLA